MPRTRAAHGEAPTTVAAVTAVVATTTTPAPATTIATSTTAAPTTAPPTVDPVPTAAPTTVAGNHDDSSWLPCRPATPASTSARRDRAPTTSASRTHRNRWPRPNRITTAMASLGSPSKRATRSSPRLTDGSSSNGTSSSPSRSLLSGPVALELWSTAQGFHEKHDLDYSIWLLDCAPDGTDCMILASTVDVHVKEWNGGSRGTGCSARFPSAPSTTPCSGVACSSAPRCSTITMPGSPSPATARAAYASHPRPASSLGDAALGDENFLDSAWPSISMRPDRRWPPTSWRNVRGLRSSAEGTWTRTTSCGATTTGRTSGQVVLGALGAAAVDVDALRDRGPGRAGPAPRRLRPRLRAPARVRSTSPRVPHCSTSAVVSAGQRAWRLLTMGPRSPGSISAPGLRRPGPVPDRTARPHLQVTYDVGSAIDLPYTGRGPSPGRC